MRIAGSPRVQAVEVLYPDFYYRDVVTDDATANGGEMSDGEPAP